MTEPYRRWVSGPRLRGRGGPAGRSAAHASRHRLPAAGAVRL